MPRRTARCRTGPITLTLSPQRERERKSHENSLAAFAKIAPLLEDFGKDMNGAQRAGVNVVRVALEAPLRQIAANAGIEPTGIITYVQSKEFKYNGYDFAKYSSSNGSHVWSQTFGTNKLDGGQGVSVDNNGNIFVLTHHKNGNGKGEKHLYVFYGNFLEHWTFRIGNR